MSMYGEEIRFSTICNIIEYIEDKLKYDQDNRPFQGESGEFVAGRIMAFKELIKELNDSLRDE